MALDGTQIESSGDLISISEAVRRGYGSRATINRLIKSGRINAYSLDGLPEGAAPTVHTDGGGVYRSASWKALAEGRGATRSMSRKACCPDNARAEGFFGTLKEEFFYGRDWTGASVEEFGEELDGYLKGVEGGIADCGIAPSQVASLAKLLAEDAISSNQAHEVFDLMAKSGEDPEKIVDERGMRQVSDAGALQPIVDEVLGRCTDQAQQYRDGNQKVLGFLVGQCMKASRGQGNPKLFNELLRKSLE